MAMWNNQTVKVKQPIYHPKVAIIYQYWAGATLIVVYCRASFFPNEILYIILSIEMWRSKKESLKKLQSTGWSSKPFYAPSVKIHATHHL